MGTTSFPHYEFSVNSRFSAKAGSKNMVEGHSSIPHVGALGLEGQASIYQIFRVLSALSCGYWILQKTMQVKERRSLPVRKLQSKHGNGTQVDPVVSCAGRCHQVVSVLRKCSDLNWSAIGLTSTPSLSFPCVL